MRGIECCFTVNGQEVEVTATPAERLIDVLRDALGLTGTKEGCGNGECGACTVLVDGRAVNSCLFPAIEIDGCRVTTVEGLAGEDGDLSPLQQAFVQECGIQCGFCTPGMLMAASDLLQRNGAPTDDEIRDAMTGNLCRCTGYVQIIEAVKAASLRCAEEGRA
jgi:carbon-monoxide dehydrogenase small subunit